jgi:tetratricopeptide (TPR) repeat protein
MMSPPTGDGPIIPETAPERNTVDGLLETGWLLVAILVPLGANLWARQPFEPPKAALLRSLTWVMAGLWLADCLLARCHWQLGRPVAAREALERALQLDPDNAAALALRQAVGAGP